MRMRPQINCEQFEAFILDYLEGELPFVSRTLFEGHLMVCAECRRYLAAYQQARKIGAAVLDDVTSFPDSIPEDLVHAVVDAMKA